MNAWMARGAVLWPGVVVSGVVAIAALGTKTSIGQLAAAGWRPMALILAETLFLALGVLGVIVFMR